MTMQTLFTGAAMPLPLSRTSSLRDGVDETSARAGNPQVSAVAPGLCSAPMREPNRPESTALTRPPRTTTSCVARTLVPFEAVATAPWNESRPHPASHEAAATATRGKRRCLRRRLRPGVVPICRARPGRQQIGTGYCPGGGDRRNVKDVKIDSRSSVCPERRPVNKYDRCTRT